MKKPARAQKDIRHGSGPRRAAASVLGRVFGQGAYADILLAADLASVRPEDRALTTELVYGVLRRSITLDWIMERFSTVKIKKMETAVQVALRIGLYQIFFLSRVPVRAAVDESVRLVKGARKRGFVNAVLRRAALEKDNLPWPGPEMDLAQRLSIIYSHPGWMVRRWLRRYGEVEVEALLRANLAPPRRTLRVNTLRISREDLVKKLSGLGLETRGGLYSPYALDILSGTLPAELAGEGLFAMQDEASQIVPMLLSPRPGALVLDACAAPGGKTTAMAGIMKNRGRIVAVDRYAGRLAALRRLAKTLGVTIITPIVADSSEAVFRHLKGRLPFEYILLDAPCSGLGVLGRTPDIKLHRKESDIRALAETQKRLLKNMFRLLRPGGRLVYSVCTLEPEETEEIVRWALENSGDISFENARPRLPATCATLVTSVGFLQTMPHRHHMDGFFAAIFTKKE